MSDYSVYENYELPRELDEEALESAYWEFIDNVKKNNFSDRDCFKHSMRRFARKEIDRYIQEEIQKEIEMFEEFRRERRDSNLILRKFYEFKKWIETKNETD